MRTGRIVIACLLIISLFCGIASAEDLTNVIIDSRTTQSFTDEAVSDADLRLILEAGLSAPSAINQQPWYLVAVTNQEVLDEIKGSGGGFGGAPADGFPGGAPSGDMPEGGFPGGDMPEGERPTPPQGGGFGGGAKAGLGDSPVAIIVYMNENTASPDASFDCGLACENMYIAAKALGYGAKIISSPTMQLNGENHDALCEKLGVDAACTAVAVLLVGHESEPADATSGASERSAMEEKVSIID